MKTSTLTDSQNYEQWEEVAKQVVLMLKGADFFNDADDPNYAPWTVTEVAELLCEAHRRIASVSD